MGCGEKDVLVREVPVAHGTGDTGRRGHLLNGGGGAGGDEVLGGPDQRGPGSLLLLDAPVGFVGD